MDTKKKLWKKPVLIIIGRGKSEESVLLACQNSQKAGADGSIGCLVVTANCKEPANS